MSHLFALPTFGVCLVLGFGVAIGPLAMAPARADMVTGHIQPAVDPARVARLTDTMMMDEIIAVMRDEGIEYGQTLSSEMFADKGGAQWDAIVALIYDTDTMRQRLDEALTQALSAAGGDIDGIEAFFGSPQGQEILRLEIEARRALLDNDIEEAAKLSWDDLQADGGPRMERLNRFAEVNDLIESNVMGAMNANLAFYKGLSESGAFSEEMTEDQMLSDVWGQEPDVRAETTDWLFPFLSMAYQPLSDDKLDAYIAFSESPAGQTLNTALFAAFDSVFTKISYDLGRAAGKRMQGEDI